MKTQEPYVLGISASHNGAACIMRGDRILVAVQEERLTRRKRAWVHAGAHSLCVPYCLAAAGLKPGDLDLVVASVQGYMNDAGEDIWLNPDLRVGARRLQATYVSHHFAHALSTFCTSPFDEAAVLVADGGGSPVTDLIESERRFAIGRDSGDFETISTYKATATAIEPLEKYFNNRHVIYVDNGQGMPRFGSLGCMFEAVSRQIFGNSMQAGKVMGLAPYGRIAHEPSSFLTCGGGAISFSDAVPRLYPHNRRWPDCAEDYKDLARSAQAALEHAMVILADELHEWFPSSQLCLSGGVALNGIANEVLLARRQFRDIHVYPAAEDSGVALGAACYGVWQLTGRMPRCPVTVDEHGRGYDRDLIRVAIENVPSVRQTQCDDSRERAVDLLRDGKVVGLFHGGSELGPRALGSRSLLFDPRRPDGQEYLNTQVKGREAFRPFAPVCLLEEAEEWFESEGSHLISPFMLRVVKVRPEKRDLVPAITHVDGTARLQTVTPENGPMYDLVRRFWLKTGVPMLLNTSFNVNDEPLVETPEDALLCMLCTNIDACLLDDLLVTKSEEFSTILQLTPQYVGQGMTLKVDSLQQLASGQPSVLTAATKTPWGPSNTSIGGLTLAVLRQIDGTKTGWDIVEALQREGSVTEKQVCAELAGLTRRRILRLTSTVSGIESVAAKSQSVGV